MALIPGLPRLIRWILTIGFFFLVLMTLMRITLFLFFNKQGHSFTDLTESFLLGLRFDLRAVSLILLFILVIGSIPPLNPFRQGWPRKFWISVVAFFSFAILFFYFLDFAHYSYLSQRLNASVLNYLQDTAISLNMVWQSYPLIKLVVALVLLTALLTWLIKLSHTIIEKDHQPATKRNRVISFIVLFLLLGLVIFGRFNQYPLRWSDAFALGSDYKANLALNPFESFFNTLKFRKNSYDEKKIRELYPALAPHFDLKVSDTAKLSFTRMFQGSGATGTVPNIVIVLCESFSGYKSSMWGNPLKTTPFFDSISKKGLFFDQCFTPTYGTARGVWATITGTPDIEYPATASRNPAAVDQHTIINDFTAHENFTSSVGVQAGPISGDCLQIILTI